MIAKSNDNLYGLTCGIWSRDHRNCWRIARAISASPVWVNTYKTIPIPTHFGGDGARGMRCEKERLGLRVHQRQKLVYKDMSGARHRSA